jgi:hypothetical protein
LRWELRLRQCLHRRLASRRDTDAPKRDTAEPHHRWPGQLPDPKRIRPAECNGPQLKHIERDPPPGGATVPLSSKPRSGNSAMSDETPRSLRAFTSSTPKYTKTLL